LEAEEKGNPSLIINRLNPNMVKSHDMLSAEDVIDLLAIHLIGVVPEDENVIVGTNRGMPIALEPKSRAGQAFRNIAQRLQGHDVPFLDLDHQGSLWSRLQRFAGRK